MKKFLIFLVFISAGFGVFYYQQTAVCRNPLTYDIGSLDNRFGISKEKFIVAIKEAEAIWERGVGRDLFNNQSGGKLKINMIFDDRQAATLEAERSKEQIEGSRASYDILLSKYKFFETSYRSAIAAYESRVTRFEQRLIAHNAQVAEINQRGGAKPSEYEKMQEEQRYLETQKSDLDLERLELNSRAAELNSLGDQVNDLARKLNITVDVHNDRFGEAREFDQGDYINSKINIYQFNGTSDLRLVMAHELGHALGLDHVENPESIMYYLMDKQDLNNPVLSKEDKESLIKRCTFHVPKLQEIFNYN